MRTEERLENMLDLPDASFPAGLSIPQMEDILKGAPDDLRFHLSSGALESFRNTLPLLHPRGYLQVQDIFVTDLNDYGMGFYGPGKLEGSILSWVNGALLREVAERGGYDLHFAPYVSAGVEDFDPVYDKTGVRPMNLPILPTTMVGSYSMPGWLERLKQNTSRGVSAAWNLTRFTIRP